METPLRGSRGGDGFAQRRGDTGRGRVGQLFRPKEQKKHELTLEAILLYQNWMCKLYLN